MLYFEGSVFEKCFIFANNEAEKIKYSGSIITVYLFIRYGRSECN